MEDIVTFLSQVASALHYLHVNHIVHGDLRAEYVNVMAPDKVHDMFYNNYEISRMLIGREVWSMIVKTII